MVAKMKRNQLFMVAGLLILAALFAPDALRSIASGGDTLSITSGSFKSSDPFFSGPVQVLNLVASGAGNSWSGVLMPEDVEAYTGQRPSGAFDLRVDRLEETCEYAISEEAIPLNQYTLQGMQLGPLNTGSNQGAGNPWSVGQSCQNNGVITKAWITSSKYGSYYHATCSWVTPTIAATGYYVDPTTTYYNKIQVTLASGGEEYSVILDPNNLEGGIENVMRVKFIGSFVGQQSCPAISSNYVAYRLANTNNLELKNKYIFENTRGQCAYVDALNYQSCNGAVAAVAADSPLSMFSCEVIDWAGEGTTAKIKCQPTSSTTIPVLQVILPDAGGISTVVPVGKPEILSAKAGNVEAAQFAQVLVEVKNSGEDASFDVSLDCGRLSPTSKRVGLLKGETAVVSVPYSGAGIIEKCLVEMVDVNNAANKDTLETTIDIAPFCDRVKPSAAHVVAYTREFGCIWICPNQHSANIFEGDCTDINYASKEAAYYDYEKTINEYDDDGNFVTKNMTLKGNTWMEDVEYNRVTEAHCTGVGKYVSAVKYVDENMNFIPSSQAHKVWIPAPTCAYADAYGWENGVQITDGYQFTYGVTPSTGQSEEAGFTAATSLSSGGFTGYGNFDSITNSVKTSVETSTGLPCLVVLAFAAVGGFMFWKYVLKRR